ncbi:hypothetical protein EUGRSUZ_F02775 [Eucalyptus grandis]|uniref:Uncharacterized protein n=2 Tax=Eucalyptus grandis TaxID=71139 RepID=A0ACC3KJ75_EUCGR|nr:hypothetical protein EUGRSUZ_F02775 [Eucalyptus grandis]
MQRCFMHTHTHAHTHKRVIPPWKQKVKMEEVERPRLAAATQRVMGSARLKLPRMRNLRNIQEHPSDLTSQRLSRAFSYRFIPYIYLHDISLELRVYNHVCYLKLMSTTSDVHVKVYVGITQLRSCCFLLSLFMFLQL